MRRALRLSGLSVLLLIPSLACGEDRGLSQDDAPAGNEPLVIVDDSPSPLDPAAPDESEPEPEQEPEQAVAEPARPDLPSGGYLEATRFVSGDEVSASALAELWTSFTGPAEPGRMFYDVFPEDSCFQVPVQVPQSTFYDFVDVGEQITLRGPSNVDLVREAIFSNIFYRAPGGTPGALHADETYDVELGSGGVWSDALRMPAVPVVDEPAELATGNVWLTDGDALTVRFQPVGADRVYFIMQADELGVVCRMADDGEFQVPAQALASAPVYGTMVVLAVNRTFVEHDGRAVEVLGTTGAVASYDRP